MPPRTAESCNAHPHATVYPRTHQRGAVGCASADDDGILYDVFTARSATPPCLDSLKRREAAHLMIHGSVAGECVRRKRGCTKPPGQFHTTKRDSPHLKFCKTGCARSRSNVVVCVPSDPLYGLCGVRALRKPEETSKLSNF